MATRWDIAPDGNCHVQCFDCNRKHSHVGRESYENAYIQRFGRAKLDELAQRARGIIHLSVNELRDIRERFRIALHIHN